MINININDSQIDLISRTILKVLCFGSFVCNIIVIFSTYDLKKRNENKMNKASDTEIEQ